MKLLHFADLHLGLENYGRTDSSSGVNTRFLDFLRCFDFLVEEALRRRVDLVLFAGDAFRSREPSPTHQCAFAERVYRLAQAGIPVFLLLGNHDLPAHPSRANSLSIFSTLQVPGVIVASRAELHRVATPAGPLQIAAVPALARSQLLSAEEMRSLDLETLRLRLGQKLGEIVQTLAGQVDCSCPAVLAAHFSVEGATLGSEANLALGGEPLAPRALVADPTFDYVALGHLHKFQNLNPGGQPPVVYAGSLDRVDFSEERDEKGFVVAEVSQGAASCELVATPAREFITLRVRVEGGDATAQVLEAISAAPVKDRVVRLVVAMREQQPLDERAIRQALREAFWLCPPVKEVAVAQDRRRAPALTEQLANPMEALEQYLHTRDFSAERRERLREYGARLLARAAEEGWGEGEV